ncbi:MAG: hypothetical protein K0R09_588 [Clostridiales bacterium]|nr:hypothetical protein [Clostridiales bacterium]
MGRRGNGDRVIKEGSALVYKNILKIMVCPRCGEKLMLNSREEINGDVIDGTLTCANNHR